MTLITEQEAVNQFPITTAQFAEWKTKHKLQVTTDETRGELFDYQEVDALVKGEESCKFASIQDQVLGKIGTSVRKGPNGWEMASTICSGIAALAAVVAIWVAGVQFAGTRRAISADNGYRVWTDLLQAAKEVQASQNPNWAPVNDRLIAAKALHDAGNLNNESWTAILRGVCPSKIADLKQLGNGGPDMEKFCREYLTQPK
jgi:hypothetical protein